MFSKENLYPPKLSKEIKKESSEKDSFNFPTFLNEFIDPKIDINNLPVFYIHPEQGEIRYESCAAAAMSLKKKATLIFDLASKNEGNFSFQKNSGINE